MKIVLLTNKNPNQIALAAKIHAACGLAGIVYSQNIPQKRKGPLQKLRALSSRLQTRLFGWPFILVWSELQKSYSAYTAPEGVPSIVAKNVNEPDVLDFLNRLAVDLVVVSGTNLVGRKITEYGQKHAGVVNLHTGISPYIKGGPNCTNWCLATNQLHLIGSTVMWLDLGVDTGDLICTERAPLTGDESLIELHQKVMNHAHDIYVRAIQKIVNRQSVSRVKQSDIGEGQTFATADWSGRQMGKAYQNFKRFYNSRTFSSSEFAAKVRALKLVGGG